MIRTSYIAKLKYIENSFDYFIYIVRSKPATVPMSDNKIWFSALGPSKTLLYSYKRNDIDYKKFSELYLKELKLYGEDQIRWIVNKHNEGKKICLLCYEKDPNVCHRKILGTILEHITKDTVKEWNP